MFDFLKPDPKLGWHSYWITPLVLAMVTFGYIIYPFMWTYKSLKYKHYRHSTRHLDRIRKLAGIK